MSLVFAALNSGSNANCYYVGNQEEAVLVDAGLSCSQTEFRLQRLGLDPRRIRAIFVSHEHTDHIRGVARLAKKYGLPVYVTPQTGRQLAGLDQKLTVQTLCDDAQVQVGALQVRAFAKCHDAVDPLSFVISQDGVTVGVFTDIGTPCDRLVHHFRQCQAVFLEANYDEQMLEFGSYPYYLKQRIRGGHGHLSNQQALDLFRTHRSPDLAHVILAHLSAQNNSPQVAHDLFRPHMGTTRLTVASRLSETPLFSV